MDIKAHLLRTLKNEKILNLTGDKKVHFLHANNPEVPYIEYEILRETGGAYAEGKETFTNYLVQVDIFSKNDYSDLEKEIKTAMLNAGYNRGQARDLYEEKTKLKHKAMRFNISLPFNL